MTRPIPPQDDLVRLAQQALFNARDQLSDARMLLRAERASTAFALATLADEEVGKASLCILVLIPAGVLDADGFWDCWRDHGGKLLWARGLLQVIIREPTRALSKLLEDLTREAKTLHQRKMRALYVDYSPSGLVLSPSATTAAQARSRIDEAQASLDFLLASWGDDGIFERVKDLSAHQDELAAELEWINGALRAEPDKTLGQMRDWIHAQREQADGNVEDSTGILTE